MTARGIDPAHGSPVCTAVGEPPTAEPVPPVPVPVPVPPVPTVVVVVAAAVVVVVVTGDAALMSGPAAPHLLCPRVMTSPGFAAPRTVMIRASLVIEVDPGAFWMVCTLASIEMSGARGPRPVSTAFGVVGTGTAVPPMVRPTIWSVPVDPVALEVQVESRTLAISAVVEPAINTLAFSTRPSLFTCSLARVLLVELVVAVSVALVNTGLRGTAIVVEVAVPEAGRVTAGVGGSAGMGPPIEAPNALPVRVSGPVAAPAEPAKKAKEPRATPMASSTAPTRRNKPTGRTERALVVVDSCMKLTLAFLVGLRDPYSHIRSRYPMLHTPNNDRSHRAARWRGSADRMDFPNSADIGQLVGRPSQPALPICLAICLELP